MAGSTFDYNNVSWDSSGNMTVNNLTLPNAPTAPTDATNKAYVDLFSSGIIILAACVCGTTANLSATYFNGTSGVGATLTATGNGALVVDGVTVSASDRVLVDNQSTLFQNGIYTVSDPGSPSTPWQLIRAVDFDSSSNIKAGSTTLVTSGTINAGINFTMITPNPITVGTTPILWTMTSNNTSALLKVNNLSDLTNAATARVNIGLSTAGGDLTGTLPNPSVIPATTSTAGKVQLATSAQTTAGLAVQASDTRLSDSRAPTGSAGGVLSATYPNPGFASIAANSFYINNTGSSAAPAAFTLSASKLLGTDASSILQAISIGSGLTLAANTLSASGSSGISTVAIQIFNSSGTYTPTSGMKYCIVFVIGAGGGGGGCTGTLSSSAGGTSGALCISLWPAATIGASKSVSVGTGGTGSLGNNPGNVGGGTSFDNGGGASTIALGGPGGNGMGNVSSGFSIALPQAMGAGNVGQLTFLGSVGGMALCTVSGANYSGFGGAGPWGGSCAGRSTQGNGNNGPSPGSGGGGALCSGAVGGETGGNGHDGQCFILEFC